MLNGFLGMCNCANVIESEIFATIDIESLEVLEQKEETNEDNIIFDIDLKIVLNCSMFGKGDAFLVLKNDELLKRNSKINCSSREIIKRIDIPQCFYKSYSCSINFEIELISDTYVIAFCRENKFEKAKYIFYKVLGLSKPFKIDCYEEEVQENQEFDKKSIYKHQDDQLIQKSTHSNSYLYEELFKKLENQQENQRINENQLDSRKILKNAIDSFRNEQNNSTNKRRIFNQYYIKLVYQNIIELLKHMSEKDNKLKSLFTLSANSLTNLYKTGLQLSEESYKQGQVEQYHELIDFFLTAKNGDLKNIPMQQLNDFLKEKMAILEKQRKEEIEKKI